MIWCSNWTVSSASMVSLLNSVMLPTLLLTPSWLVLSLRRPDSRLSSEIIKKSRRIRNSHLRMKSNKKWLNYRTQMQEKCIYLNKKLRELSQNKPKMRRRPKQRIKRWLHKLKVRRINKSLMLMVTNQLLSRRFRPRQLTWLINPKLKPTLWSLTLVSRPRSWALSPMLNLKMWRLSMLPFKLSVRQSQRISVLLMLKDSTSMKWERLNLTENLLPIRILRLSWVEHLVRTWSTRFSISMGKRNDDFPILDF